jgi:hypothetical protein
LNFKSVSSTVEKEQMQRHLKPPPKVIPPKPPAHLFEPNYDVINERYQPREEPERFRREIEGDQPVRSHRDEIPLDNNDFEKDVAEQMRELESSIFKIMKENKIGEPSSSVSSGDPFAAMKQYDSDRDPYPTGGKDNVPLSQESIQKFLGPNQGGRGQEREERGNYASFPSSSAVGSYKKQAASYEPSSHYPPQKSSPVKRMGAINNLFGNESDLMMKAEKQAAYSQQLLKDQQRNQQLLHHNHNPIIVSQQNSSLQRGREEDRREREPPLAREKERERERERNDGGGGGGLQIGNDRQRELEIKKAKQIEYRLQLDSQQHYQHPQDLPSQNSARREEDPYYRSERKHMGQQEQGHIYHPSERKHAMMQDPPAKIYPSRGSCFSLSLSFFSFLRILLLFFLSLLCLSFINR